MRDRLEGAYRPAELLALLRVFDAHLETARRPSGFLCGKGDEGAVHRCRDNACRGAILAHQTGAGSRKFQGGEPPGQIEGIECLRFHPRVVRIDGEQAEARIGLGCDEK